MFKKRLLAHWFIYDNFGDLLTPYIIEKLTGIIPEYRWAFNEQVNYKNEIREIIKCIKNRRRYNWGRLYPSELKKPVVLGVGSIIDQAYSNSLIWGAGFMNEDEVFHGGDVLAVRGKYTAEKLLKDGFSSTDIFGDPALLLPIVCSKKKSPANKYGIIPHLKDEKSLRSLYNNQNIISMQCNYNVETVIEEILKCSYIISTSLHGIIVAHAYGIPAIWVKMGNIDSDGFKFYDYFSSVEIPEYKGSNFAISDFLEKDLSDLPLQIRNLMYPSVDISIIQKKLLRCAPFELLPKYHKYL